MKTWIIELEDDNFDTVFAETEQEAEEEAYNRYGFNYLSVKTEESEENKIDSFDKHTPIKEAWEILNTHGIYNTRYSDLTIALMVTNCHHIEVIGYGRNAKLKIVTSNKNL